jgi:hypothetical protein
MIPFNQKYDCNKLRQDCLNWCLKEELPEWMLDAGLSLWETPTNYQIVAYHDQVRIAQVTFSKDFHNGILPLAFARYIGLDIDYYRRKENPYEVSVRSFLEGIKDGGSVLTGWLKSTRPNGEIIAVNKHNGVEIFLWGQHSMESLYVKSYYFLRLDTKQGFKVITARVNNK